MLHMDFSFGAILSIEYTTEGTRYGIREAKVGRWFPAATRYPGNQMAFGRGTCPGINRGPPCPIRGLRYRQRIGLAMV